MSNIDLSCFNETTQNFLICITIYRATNLKILNANTFVVVNFNNIFKRTTICNNSDNPYFNEYFVFDIESNLADLLKKPLIFRVFQLKCLCRRNVALGEVFLDLSTIWSYPSKFTI